MDKDLPIQSTLLNTTCMECGEECSTWEIVYTGNFESLNGEEIWCYCEKCKLDTFHLISI